MRPILNLPKFATAPRIAYNTSPNKNICFKGELKSDEVCISKPPKVLPGLTVTDPTREDIKKIQAVEIQAFDKLAPITKDFDSYEEEIYGGDMDTFVIKNSDKKVIGYYKTEDWGKSLYIYALAVPKEVRKTPDSKLARTQMFMDFKRIAKEKNMETVALHTDSCNPNLVKMYEKHGFVQQNFGAFRYANGNKAVYMLANVDDIKF